MTHESWHTIPVPVPRWYISKQKIVSFIPVTFKKNEEKVNDGIGIFFTVPGPYLLIKNNTGKEPGSEMCWNDLDKTLRCFDFQENEQLEERIKLLSKELTFLKDIFLAHASTNHGMDINHLGIRELFEDEVSPKKSIFIFCCPDISPAYKSLKL